LALIFRPHEQLNAIAIAITPAGLLMVGSKDPAPPVARETFTKSRRVRCEKLSNPQAPYKLLIRG
jgi:hypothetical protein